MDWTFGGAWPYEPRWFDSQEGRMHYVDEGPRDGRPVVLMHGTPTWSFLYRHFIPPLTAGGHRAIAVDDLGFGRSDKPDRPALYSIERHCRRVEALLESLDLRDATLVPQDWGGRSGCGGPPGTRTASTASSSSTRLPTAHPARCGCRCRSDCSGRRA